MAATLATAGPALLHEYGQPGADKAAISIVFAVLIDVVFRVIWQLLNGVLLGVWWCGIARLMHVVQPRFARLSAILAALAWIATASNVLGFGLARDATLGIVFLLWAIWSIWWLCCCGVGKHRSLTRLNCLPNEAPINQAAQCLLVT